MVQSLMINVYMPRRSLLHRKARKDRKARVAMAQAAGGRQTSNHSAKHDENPVQSGACLVVERVLAVESQAGPGLKQSGRWTEKTLDRSYDFSGRLERKSRIKIIKKG